MANFKTHLSVASTLSGVGAIGLLGGGVASQQDVLLYFALGTIGGILPDIDSDNSIPVRILFSSLAILLSFLAMFSKIGAYSIIELSTVWIVSYLIVRYLFFKVFVKFTIHRGVFHSLLAAAFFWFLTTSICYNFVHLNKFIAWMAGCFICLGYLIHLSLDEIYSVDLRGIRIKKSFGTALKPVSLRYLKATIALLLLTVLVFYTTPKADFFVQRVLNAGTYLQIKEHLLPKARWFKIYDQLG